MREATEYIGEKIYCTNMIYMVEEEPTVDAEPVRHGKWIKDGSLWRCSLCEHKTGQWLDTPYCPYCGAKMDLIDL